MGNRMTDNVLYVPWFVETRGPPSGERLFKSIDFLPLDDKVNRKALGLDGACVVVDGVLHLYGPNTVPIGNLLSEYGAVDVRAIHKCSAE